VVGLRGRLAPLEPAAPGDGLLATLMVPTHVTLIPTFFILRWLGWVDTHWALKVPWWMGGAFGTFLLRQFFLTIPVEMMEAAKIDGAGYWRIFWRIDREEIGRFGEDRGHRPRRPRLRQTGPGH
jgi:hypothetical protein